MAAKDYTFGAGWKDIYLTKKTKPRKDGLHVMSTDRYLLICSDSIPKGFNKKKLAKDQFKVEY